MRLQQDALNSIWILSSLPPSSQRDCMLFCVAVIKLPVNNCDKIPIGKKATRHHARGAVMQTAESLRDSRPCSHTIHCISQMPPTAKSNHNFSIPRKPRPPYKNEQYYHFTDSCQKDINRIQLQRRLDTEILLCVANKRQTLSRRLALMQCYETKCMELEGRKAFTLWTLI